MPFSQARKTNFNALRRLNLEQRIEAISDPRMGQFLISMLSPTQAAELFPKYYIERNQNISGFLKAIPSSLSAAKQKEYEQQLQNTVSGESAGANYNAGGYRKKWQKEMDNERQRSQVTKKFETPLPQLSPEQKQAFEALKAGDIGVNDDRVKFLKNISDADLTRAGLTRIKDDKGDARYHYQAPQVSDEDVKRSAAMGSGRKYSNAQGAALMRSIGASPEEAAWLGAVVQQESGGGNPKAHNDGNPNRERSYGLWQININAHTFDKSYMRAAGVSSVEDLYDPVKNAKVALYLYRHSNPEKTWGAFRDINAGNSQYGSWKKNYQEAMEGALGKVPAPAGADPITQNYTPQQLEAKKRELQSQMEAERLGELAKITQPGGPTNASDTIGVNQQGKWESLNLYKGGSGHGYCAKGVVQVVKQLYQGNKFFDGRGVDGNGHAFQHKDGSFFTSSGLYNSSRPMSEDEIVLAKAGKLPPGTVVVTQGGKDGVYGHIQIMGNGQWLSDHRQRRFYAPGEGGNGPGRTPWREPYIIYPNEQGKKVLSQNGYATYTPTETTATQQDNPPPAPTSTYKPLGEEAPNPLDEETRKTASVNLTRDLQSERKAVVQGSLSFEGGGTYHFGSGRPDDPDHPSTPLGSSEVGGLNPHHVPGGVGYEMPALNNRLDPKVGRSRNGMVIHSSGHDDLERLYSHGCISIPKSEFPAFQQEMDNFKKSHGGKAYINIMPDGRVTVTSSPAYSSDGTPLTPMSSEQAVKEIQTNQPQVVQSATQVASGDIKPLETVTQPQGPLNTPKAEALPAPASTPAAPPAPAPAPAAPPAPAPEEPTATVQKPAEQPKPAAPTPERYNVNMSKFIGAIKQTDDFKNTPLSWMATDSMITDGFNKDPRVQAAGVRLDEKGVMHFTKGMTPEAKEAMATFDTKSFMTKIEDKKKEDTPTQVKPKAKGGTTKVSTEEIAAYPIGGLQGDNAVVVNAQQQPLFTMNTNEAAVMNPDTKTVDVIPNQKNKQVGPQQQPDNTPVMNEFNSAIQDLQKDFDNLSKKDMKQPDMTTTQPEQFNQSWLAALGHVTEIPYRNPTAHRVASRAHGVETGTADNGYHFSHGNKS